MSKALIGVACLVLLAACSSDDASSGSSTTGGAVTTSAGGTTDPDGTLEPTDGCATGDWVSTFMIAPSQAAIGEVTPTGGGDGMVIHFGEDHVFQVDFGPMQPATATFTSGGQEGTLTTTMSGVEKGTWSVDGQSRAVGTTDDFTTASATAELILGETVPPIFDETFQQLNDNRMLGGAKVGIFTVITCSGDTMTMTSPFPGGEIVIDAERQG